MSLFNSTGRTASEIREEIVKQAEISSNQVIPLGIKMPIEKGVESYETLFKMNTDLFKQISNNYKMFLTTKKGELLCKPDFGTSITDAYNRTDLDIEDIENIVMDEISKSTEKYFPFIILRSFESKLIGDNNENLPNYVQIEISYSIRDFESQNNVMILNIRRSI